MAGSRIRAQSQQPHPTSPSDDLFSFGSQRRTGPQPDMVDVVPASSDGSSSAMGLLTHLRDAVAPGLYAGYAALKPTAIIPRLSHDGVFATNWFANIGHAPARAQQCFYNLGGRIKGPVHLGSVVRFPVGLQLAIDQCSAARMLPQERRTVTDGHITDAHDGSRGRTVFKAALNITPFVWLRRNYYARPEARCNLNIGSTLLRTANKRIVAQRDDAPVVLFGQAKHILGSTERFCLGASLHDAATEADLLQSLDVNGLQPGEVVVDTAWAMKRDSLDLYPPGPVAFGTARMSDHESFLKVVCHEGGHRSVEAGLKSKQTTEYSIDYGSVVGLINGAFQLKRPLPNGLDLDSVLRSQLPKIFYQDRKEQSVVAIARGERTIDPAAIGDLQQAVVAGSAAVASHAQSDAQPTVAPAAAPWYCRLFASVWPKSLPRDALARARMGYDAARAQLQRSGLLSHVDLGVSWSQQASLRMQMIPMLLQRLAERMGVSRQEQKHDVTIACVPSARPVHTERSSQAASSGERSVRLMSHLKNAAGFERAVDATVALTTQFVESCGDQGNAAAPLREGAKLTLRCSISLPAVDATRLPEAEKNWRAAHDAMAVWTRAAAPQSDAFLACSRRIEASIGCSAQAMAEAIAQRCSDLSWQATQYSNYGVCLQAGPRLAAQMQQAGDDAHARHQALMQFVRDAVPASALDRLDSVSQLRQSSAEPFQDATLSQLMALGCLSELVADTSSPSALTHDIGANELEAIRTELSRGAGKLYASHALLIDSERAARASTLLRGWHQLTSVRQARSSKLSHANVAATGRQILAAYAVVSPSSPSLLPVAAPAGADAVDPALLHSLARTALAKELLLKGGRPVTTTSGAHYPRRLLGSARADGDLIDDVLARLGHVSPAKPDLQLGDQLSAALDIAIAFQLEGDHWPIDVVAALCVLAQGYAAARSSNGAKCVLSDFLSAQGAKRAAAQSRSAKLSDDALRVDRARCSQAHFDALWSGGAYRPSAADSALPRQVA